MELGLPNLPFEIVYDILSRLPVKSLCRFKSVSKPWVALINDPNFIKSHLHQSMKNNTNQKLIIPPDRGQSSKSCYSMDYQAPNHTLAELEMPCKSGVHIHGSCNGVLLLDSGAELWLWNPSIRRYKKFSRPKCPDTHYCVISGPGYDAIGDDFKVVAVFYGLRYAFINVQVFSSKLSSWKSIGYFGYTRSFQVSGTVLNGALHWIVRGNTSNAIVYESGSSHRGSRSDFYFHIVYFDFMEKLKEVPKPIYEVDFLEYDHSYLGVLGGWLCVVDTDWKSHYDVWVMKEYGVKESWTKLFVVTNVAGGEFFFRHFQLLCFTKGGEVIMKLDSQKLVIYNPKQNRFKRIMIPQNCRPFDVALYVESLVSPHGCNDTRRYY